MDVRIKLIGPMQWDIIALDPNSDSETVLATFPHNNGAIRHAVAVAAVSLAYELRGRVHISCTSHFVKVEMRRHLLNAVAAFGLPVHSTLGAV